MESNDSNSSAGTVKEKLSLRKRLLIKKSTKVGCSADSTPESNDTIKNTSKNNVYENGQRMCLSDSEANSISPKAGSSKLPNSESVFLASSQSAGKLPARPKSMVENNNHKVLNSSNDKMYDKFSSPVNRNVDVLRRPSHIYKAYSDPNCDMVKISQNGACSPRLDDEIFSNSRMSSSLSAMQQSSDEQALSDGDNADGRRYHSPVPRRIHSRNGSGLKSNDSKISTSVGSGSTDSLARNSLLAAKVLRLIPTQKARERNFLHGRLASNSLLGVAELERVFPNREVEIFVGTWNMNGQMPPSELNDFLFPTSVEHVPDILAIGTQESISEKTEWEICIQEALGPSHLLFHSTNLGTLHLSIFIRRDLIWFCSLPEDASISVRPGTAFRTKGAVAISFALFGTTFLFVTAHLTAHQEKVKERVHDIKRIVRALDLPKNLPLKSKNKDVTCNFDVVMWCGDLNFRLSEDRASVLRGLSAPPTSPPSPSLFPSLLQADQLSAVLAGGTTLRGFREAPIHFPPTYKYDPGTQRFDTSSKQRAPAYTDRILYKTRSTTSNSSLSGLRRASGAQNLENVSAVNCLGYDSVPSICSSDHKPVWALFTASLRPGTDIVPLAAGLFNREVYLEGIKRRAAVLDHPPGTSAVCSIQ